MSDNGEGEFTSDHQFDPLYLENPIEPGNVGRNCFKIMQILKAFSDGLEVLRHHPLSDTSDDGLIRRFLSF
jgi:hypothetical protein